MKMQSSEKEAEVGQNLKRQEKPKGKSTVNGHAVFENGNMVKPKVEQEIADFVEKKKQLTKPNRENCEDLPDEEDPKWENYCTINNVKSLEKREEIKQMIEAVLALPDVTWSRIPDFIAKTHNRIILKICALSRPPTWSVMCPALGPNICRYTFEEVMGAIPKAHAMFHKSKSGTAKKVETPQKSISGDEAVAILKEKVEGLNKSSKGFVVPKEVRVTDPSVKEWIKENCYSAVADKIMLNRIP